MPFRDGTGPLGTGPIGRRMGPCGAGRYARPYYGAYEPYPVDYRGYGYSRGYGYGRGYGMGYGRGYGRGYGMGYGRGYGRGYSRWGW